MYLFSAFIFIRAYDLYGNDTMYWLDGTAVDSGYTNYNEESINGGDEDALYMDNSFGWEWGDYYPAELQTFLCEMN